MGLFLVVAPALGIAADGRVPRGSSVRVASEFPGTDVGAQVNAAYADLPDHGGAIYLNEGGTFSTPIAFTTPGKPVLLVGLPGDVVTLTYTGTGGTALTFGE